MAKHTMTDLLQMQALPLEARMTMVRVQGWINEYGRDGVYISFSGGKDSTVLMDIIRNRMGYDIPAVFADVPTQFPELRDFATSFENVEVVRPHLSFMEVCEKYGFPLISKDVAQCLYDVSTQAKIHNVNKRDTSMWNRAFNPESDYAKKYPSFTRARFDFLIDAPFDCSHLCCNKLKKEPLKDYEKRTGRKPILATMACESRLRQSQWFQDGCNAFNVKRPTSKPMSFWTEQDVLTYIHTNFQFVLSMEKLLKIMRPKGLWKGKLHLKNFHKTKFIRQQEWKEQDACFADSDVIQKMIQDFFN